MLLDANLLLYAVDQDSPHHDAAKSWLESVLTGPARIALPWQTLTSFLRIATHPRIYRNPLSGAEAWSYVDEWLSLPGVWVPPTGAATTAILGELMAEVSVSADLVPDAALAALAIEHGLAVVSADSDFARFPACRWTNPLVG